MDFLGFCCCAGSSVKHLDWTATREYLFRCDTNTIFMLGQRTMQYLQLLSAINFTEISKQDSVTDTMAKFFFTSKYMKKSDLNKWAPGFLCINLGLLGLFRLWLQKMGAIIVSTVSPTADCPALFADIPE